MESSINWTLKPFPELSLEELYQSLKLRQMIFVVEQICPYVDCDDADQKSWHLFGKNEAGELLAYMRMLPKGESYEDAVSLGRVITHPKARGKGLGKMVMQRGMNFLRAVFPGETVRISAQKHLKRFYESFGFQVSGPGYLEDGIPHLPMHLKLDGKGEEK